MTQTLAFLALRARHINAKRAIARGEMTPDEIKAAFHLSATAYAQLAGIVRSGCVS